MKIPNLNQFLTSLIDWYLPSPTSAVSSSTMIELLFSEKNTFFSTEIPNLTNS